MPQAPIPNSSSSRTFAAMSKYSHDTIVPFEGSDKSKKEQVAGMFDQIAFRYDFLNRFLSGGIDIYWRKKALRELVDIKPKYVLDVATGTADLAIMTWIYHSNWCFSDGCQWPIIGFLWTKGKCILRCVHPFATLQSQRTTIGRQEYSIIHGRIEDEYV